MDFPEDLLVFEPGQMTLESLEPELGRFCRHLSLGHELYLVMSLHMAEMGLDEGSKLPEVGSALGGVTLHLSWS